MESLMGYLIILFITVLICKHEYPKFIRDQRKDETNGRK